MCSTPPSRHAEFRGPSGCCCCCSRAVRRWCVDVLATLSLALALRHSGCGLVPDSGTCDLYVHLQCGTYDAAHLRVRRRAREVAAYECALQPLALPTARGISAPALALEATGGAMDRQLERRGNHRATQSDSTREQHNLCTRSLEGMPLGKTLQLRLVTVQGGHASTCDAPFPSPRPGMSCARSRACAPRGCGPSRCYTTPTVPHPSPPSGCGALEGEEERELNGVSQRSTHRQLAGETRHANAPASRPCVGAVALGPVVVKVALVAAVATRAPPRASQQRTRRATPTTLLALSRGRFERHGAERRRWVQHGQLVVTDTPRASRVCVSPECAAIHTLSRC